MAAYQPFATQAIKAANGDFIFFLDVDNRLSKGFVKALADFCDNLSDDVDLVTYSIETMYRGNLQQSHFRYRHLVNSDVYDLNVYSYIGQTTMNIVVRNRFKDNILFDENMTFNEDQKYCCQVMQNSLEMGFYTDTKYIYNRSENSFFRRVKWRMLYFLRKIFPAKPEKGSSSLQEMPHSDA